MSDGNGKRACVDCGQSYLLPRMRYRRGQWRCDECSDRDRFHGSQSSQSQPRRQSDTWVPPADYPPQFIGRTWTMVGSEGMIQSHYPSLSLGEDEANDYYELKAYRTEYYGRPENKNLDYFCVRCRSWYVTHRGMVCGHCHKRDDVAAGITHQPKLEGERVKPKPKKAPTKRRESLRTSIPGVR